MNQVSDFPVSKTDLEWEILQQLDKITETGNKFRDQILELGEKLKSLQTAECEKNQKLQAQSSSASPDWMKPIEAKLQEMTNAKHKISEDVRALEKRRFNLQEIVAGKLEDVLKDVATLKSWTETAMEVKPKLSEGRKTTRDLESRIEKMKRELKENLDLLESATTRNQNAVRSFQEKFGFPKLTELMDSDGWIVIQRRQSGPREEFERGWTEYENGFGSLDGNFWLGLKNIRELTADGSKELRVELTDWEGNLANANYSKFSVANAAELYRLTVGGYSGNAGDSLYVHNGGQFSTMDKKTGNFEGRLKGGWWKDSNSVSLNGLYYDEKEAKEKDSDYSGVYWHAWKRSDYSLHKVMMKIRKRK